MNVVQIFGLVVSVICAVCGTILFYKWMEIRAERDKANRAAIKDSYDRIVHDNFRLAYEDEYARRKDVEFRLKITQRELKRAREQMAKIKISEVK